MAYSTGTATDINDLLDQFVTFVEANGWTRDSYGTESTGKRYHAHRSTVYLNMRSFVAEVPNSAIWNSPVSCTSLSFNIGTGYSGASAWYDQAGTVQDGSSKYAVAGMNGLTGAISAYHFFAHDSGDSVIAVVEYVSGYYQFLAFGTLTKYGTYTGGEYMTGSHSGVINTNQQNSSSTASANGFFHATVTGGSADLPAGTNRALVNADVDAETGWKFSQATPKTGKRSLMESTYAAWYVGAPDQPSTLNSLQIMRPVIAEVSRDTTNSYSTSGRSFLGEIPRVFYIMLDTLTPAQQITLGATNYRVFPFAHKSSVKDNPSNGPSGSSGYLGFAVEE